MYTQSQGYRNVTYRHYFVLEVEKGKKSILYAYPNISSDEGTIYNKLTKPSSFTFTIYDTVEELNKNENGRAYNQRNFRKLSGTLEEYNLYVPKKDEPFTSVELVEKRDSHITDEMFEKIKRLRHSDPIAIVGTDYNNATGEDSDSILIYYCPKCRKTYHYGENKQNYHKEACPTCNRNAYNNEIISKEFKDFRKKEFGDYASYKATFDRIPNSKKERFLFVCKHPENESGIIIYKICREVSIKKNVITINYSAEYGIEHIVGEKMVCVKYLKKGEKECDPFEALNINTKTMYDPGTILYDDAEDFMEFALKNEKFLKMSGFQAVLKYSSQYLNLRAFFLIFIGIVNKYPIIEQIVKMGHAKIFFGLYNSILESLNKTEISEKIEKIAQIVDPEAKKGKDALRFPIYIGDYLIKKDAPLEEYYYWRDIYEITHITKEQFENFIDSFNYAWVNSQASLDDIGNILKFDYPLEKLFNYIIKQSRTYNSSIRTIIDYMTDYLNMCDILQVEPDKYPQNVRKVHDDMLIHFKTKERIEYDKKLNIIGVECERYVIPSEDELDNVGIPKLFKELIVVFPKCESDFITEGNQQHNCVGSYPNRVRNGNCIIFFVRKKDEPNKSFITAECTGSGLGQCMYSNNRRVTDEDLLKFNKYICQKIRSGVSSGQIHALSKA
jgi:hypothetical protein